MKNGKYEASDLTFATLGRQATFPTFLLLKEVVEFVAGFTREKDKKHPLFSLSWILQHSFGCSEKASLEHAYDLLSLLNQADNNVSFERLLERLICIRRPSCYLPPHNIYLAFDKNTEELLDIAGFVPDDRDAGKIQGLAEIDPAWIGFFGGHYVREDKRGLGIGSLMIEHRVQVVQDFVDEPRHKDATVYAFLTNETSGRLLVKHWGFQHIGAWNIKYSGEVEQIFCRRFVPSKPDTSY